MDSYVGKSSRRVSGNRRNAASWGERQGHVQRVAETRSYDLPRTAEAGETVEDVIHVGESD